MALGAVSSVVERPTFNRLVVGSNPTRPSNFTLRLAILSLASRHMAASRHLRGCRFPDGAKACRSRPQAFRSPPEQEEGPWATLPSHEDPQVRVPSTTPRTDGSAAPYSSSSRMAAPSASTSAAGPVPKSSARTEPGGVHDGLRQIAATGEYGPMHGVIGRVRPLSPRSARRSTPGGAGACYNFLYCIKTPAYCDAEVVHRGRNTVMVRAFVRAARTKQPNGRHKPARSAGLGRQLARPARSLRAPSGDSKGMGRGRIPSSRPDDGPRR
jgi:hypothetical protein